MSQVWPKPPGFAPPLHPQLLCAHMKTNTIFRKKRCYVSGFDLELPLCLGTDLNCTRYFCMNLISICFPEFFFFTQNWQENIQFASNQFPRDFFFFFFLSCQKYLTDVRGMNRSLPGWHEPPLPPPPSPLLLCPAGGCSTSHPQLFPPTQVTRWHRSVSGSTCR